MKGQIQDTVRSASVLSPLPQPVLQLCDRCHVVVDVTQIVGLLVIEQFKNGLDRRGSTEIIGPVAFKAEDPLSSHALSIRLFASRVKISNVQCAGNTLVNNL